MLEYSITQVKKYNQEQNTEWLNKCNETPLNKPRPQVAFYEFFKPNGNRYLSGYVVSIKKKNNTIHAKLCRTKKDCLAFVNQAEEKLKKQGWF